VIKPIVLSIILADHYYRDAHTGKGVIAGTFNSVNFRKFPIQFNFAVFIALTDIATSGKLQMIIREETNNKTLSLPPWKIKAPQDRQTIVEIGGNIQAIPFHTPGAYEVVVFWDDMEIASRRLKINKIEKKEQ
jgi:hypothetical protein